MSSGNRSDELWERIEPDQTLIDNALRLAERDLKTALNMLEDKDYDWAFAVSYNAMLQAGRALMFSEGYRPKGEYKHVSVIEFTKGRFSREFSEKVLFMFNKIRKKRHTAVYEQAEMISEEEAKNALDIAKEFVNKVKEILK